MQDCPEEPTHGYDGEAATFCQAHMAVGMKVSFANSPYLETDNRFLPHHLDLGGRYSILNCRFLICTSMVPLGLPAGVVCTKHGVPNNFFSTRILISFFFFLCKSLPLILVILNFLSSFAYSIFVSSPHFVPPQPIAVLRPAGLHWSAELRRQATASARERSKVESEMEAGSARCTPLPPKVSPVFLLSPTNDRVFFSSYFSFGCFFTYRCIYCSMLGIAIV